VCVCVLGGGGGHLAADLAGKDPEDHGGLLHLARRLGLEGGQLRLVHGVQQGHQVLVRVLLPAPPETANRDRQIDVGSEGTATWCSPVAMVRM